MIFFLKKKIGENSLWILFLDYLLSSWSDRMWGFAVPVLFVSMLATGVPEQDKLLLLPASLFALASKVTCVLFGSSIGAWIDVTDRRRVVVTLLVLQNSTVIVASILFGLIYMFHNAWATSRMFWVSKRTEQTESKHAASLFNKF